MQLEEAPLFKQIASAVEAYVADDSTGHGLDHAWRVFRLGIRLAEAEGADPDIVCAAALTHDVHRVLRDEFVEPSETLPQVEDILDTADFPIHKRSAVLYCVEVHENYSFAGDGGPDTIEAKVVSDADNLDAMGAIGIARAARFSAMYDNPLWDPEEASSDRYEKGDFSTSLIGHFHEKLLHLRTQMYTSSARKIAAHRHEVMEEFVEEFKEEWRGQR